MPRWELVNARTARGMAIVGILAFATVGCVWQVAVQIGKLREWNNEVAPFRALGAQVVATGGGDMGYWAGQAGVGRIYLSENVGDAELAVLAKRMERFPNLDTLVLEGPKVTDAGLAHLKGLKQLKTIRFIETHVTEEGKADLRRALPNLSE